MVALQWNELALLLEAQQTVDDLSALWTTVDVITKRYDHVTWSRCNGLEDYFQGTGTAVDITNGDGSARWRIVQGLCREHCSAESMW